MRIIKLGLISFIVLSLMITGMSLFIPSHIRISKAINIKAERDSVMAQIKDPAKWKDWYPGMDSAELFYENGILKGVVFDNGDSAHQVYVNIIKEESEEVTAEFTGKKIRPILNGWKTISYPTTDSITLQWYMDFHLRWYPWEKFSSLFLEKSYGLKMEGGLLNIKKIVQ